MKVVRDLSITSAQRVTASALAPWHAPWAAPLSGDQPGLVADFAADVYGSDGVQTNLATLVSHSRSSQATRFGATGAIETVAPDVARLMHDPVSLARLGLITEAAGENLLSNSDSPVTQTITVSAVSHVISFFGTGTVTLSGAFGQVLPGNGVFPHQTIFSFVPTSGTLTVSITGDVSFAQIQATAIASTYIPSQSGPTNRAADVAEIAVGSWFNGAEGTFVFSGHIDAANSNDRIMEIDTGSTATRLSILWNASLSKPQFQVWNGGALHAAIAPPGAAIGLDEPFRIAIAYAPNNFVVSMNGGGVAIDSTGTVPAGLTTLRIGRSRWGAQSHLTTESLVYYPSRVSDAELQALSA